MRMCEAGGFRDVSPAAMAARMTARDLLDWMAYFRLRESGGKPTQPAKDEPKQYLAPREVIKHLREDLGAQPKRRPRR